MANAIPILWKCSECFLEYENPEEAIECCDDAAIQEGEIVEDENDEEIDESDDEEEEEDEVE